MFTALEFALVQGPLTIQAEWAGQFLTNAVASNGQAQGTTAFWHGGYVEALWFLTGEVREYNKRDGVLDELCRSTTTSFARAISPPALERGRSGHASATST